MAGKSTLQWWQKANLLNLDSSSSAGTLLLQDHLKAIKMTYNLRSKCSKQRGSGEEAEAALPPTESAPFKQPSQKSHTVLMPTSLWYNRGT